MERSPVEAYKTQHLIFRDKKELYKCYMPFIVGGGLFLIFNEDITPLKIMPGQKIPVLLTLPDDSDKIPLTGKVIWINRIGNNRGFGINLGESTVSKNIKDRIENIISDPTLKKEIRYTL